MFDGLDDFFPVKAKLGDLVNHVSVDEGGGCHGVCLNDCQVAGQVLIEPGVLPAPQCKCEAQPRASDLANTLFCHNSSCWMRVRTSGGLHPASQSFAS